MEKNAQGVRSTYAPQRPLVSIILPVYNEAAILRANVLEIVAYLDTIRDKYQFEILIVNDGSRDETGTIADALASEHPDIRVLHHPTNFGVGQALRYGFAASNGDYVVVLDADLSYEPDHIGLLLDRIVQTRARLVLASAYMPGGKVTNVPWLRRFLSVAGNRFLRVLARGGISTLTCMVRAYDGRFLRSLALRSTSMALMPEIIFKAMILNARILEVPAHLDWSRQVSGLQRTSSMRIVRHIGATVLSGFLFRPVLFLILPGLLVMAFACYVNTWMFIHFFTEYVSLPEGARTASAAFALAFAASPHTFISAFLSLMLGIQLIGLGIIALQAQKYFEELFSMGTSIRRSLVEWKKNSLD